MGTSASSSGPGGGVPLVPPWVPGPAESSGQQDPTTVRASSGPLAVPGRFGSARRRLGTFAQSSDPSSLRRGLASYTKRGLGGSQNAAKRLGGVAARSGALFGALESLRSNTFNPAHLGLSAAGLAGRSTREIVDRLSRFVSPADGTQDAESSQRAVNSALSDLLASDPTIDLTSLTADQIEWVLERHIVYEIQQRIELDVGKTIVDKAPSPATAIDRLREMREYIEETVSAAFRSHRQSARPLDGSTATKLAISVIQETFGVFEEYIT
jgi:hypothetical protein